MTSFRTIIERKSPKGGFFFDRLRRASVSGKLHNRHGDFVSDREALRAKREQIRYGFRGADVRILFLCAFCADGLAGGASGKVGLFSYGNFALTVFFFENTA